MKTISLAPNPLKKDALRVASELSSWLTASGVRALVTEDISASVPGEAVSDELLAEADLLVILGGDGTMLRWGRLVGSKGTPMMGVNFGKYGFITEVQPREAQHAVARFLAGDYYLSDRVVLRASHVRRGRQMGVYHALNDVVVSKGPLARVVALHTTIGGTFIVTYAADGIIVASPTGSTAYSLSAGGPVVHPSVSVLIVTPICPHTLSARSLVVPDNETIEVACEDGEGEPNIMLTVDGQLGEHLASKDTVQVRKADFTINLVQMGPQSFYDKLRTRLRWGERFCA